MKSALKFTFRPYECLGGASSVFGVCLSSQVYTVNERLFGRHEQGCLDSTDVVAKEIIMIMKFQNYTTGIWPPAFATTAFLG